MKNHILSGRIADENPPNNYKMNPGSNKSEQAIMFLCLINKGWKKSPFIFIKTKRNYGRKDKGTPC